MTIGVHARFVNFVGSHWWYRVYSGGKGSKSPEWSGFDFLCVAGENRKTGLWELEARGAGGFSYILRRVREAEQSPCFTSL